MKQKSFLHSRWFEAIQILLALCWLSNLKQTTAYFYVCCLVAGAGILSIFRNRKTPPEPTRSMVVSSAVLSAFFSLASLAANYELFEPLCVLGNLFNTVTGLAGGFVIAMNVLHCLSALLPRKAAETGPREKGGTCFLLSFGSIAVIDLLYLLLCAFPGTVTLDSVNQLNQIAAGVYDNWHPYWHTQVIRFWMMTGKAIFGSWQAGIALFSVFQILILAAVFSYVVMTLYQREFPRKLLILVWAAYALLPYNIAYSSTMWKDVPFAAACLMLITSLYRLMAGMDKTKLRDLILFAVSGLLMCIWRSNGLPAYGFMALVLAVLGKEHRRLLKIMVPVALAGLLLMGPVLSALDVSCSNYVEALSVPLQQVARVVHDEKELTPAQRQLVESVAPLDVIQESYLPWLSDPIKNLLRESEVEEALLENPGPWLSLWAELGRKYPGEYAKAWIDQTKGYWNGGYSYWILASGVYQNDLGIQETVGLPPVKSAVNLWFRYFQMIEFLLPLISIGLHTWLMVVCTWLNHSRKRKEWILTLPVLGVLLTLLVTTPVAYEFRYIYSMFLSAPLIFSVTALDVPEERK